MKRIILICLLVCLPVSLEAWEPVDGRINRGQFQETLDREVEKIVDEVATEYLGEDYDEEEFLDLEEYLEEKHERRKQRAIEQWKRSQEGRE